jgi:hypothetical protein
MKRRQVAAFLGSRTPRQCMINSKSRPAIAVRPAISVIGGMVAMPNLMKVYDPPQSVASRSSNSNSPPMAEFRVDIASTVPRSPLVGGERKH